MPRSSNRKKPTPRRRRGSRRAVIASQRPSRSRVNFPSALKFVKNITSLLPVNTTIVSNVLGLVDLAFDWYTTVMDTSKNITRGAYAMFLVTPAPLISESPLLASSSSGLSFPGYPVKVTTLTMRLRNTVAATEKRGQWAVVFIPFREEHDADHYAKVIADLTYQEVSAMPNAKYGPCSRDLVINYNFPDPVAYCAQPREITESIGLVYIIWENDAHAVVNDKPPLTSFNCEVETSGKYKPYPIFGPKHRKDYTADVFKLKSLTTGKKVRNHHLDGTVTYSDFDPDDEYEPVTADMCE